MGAGFRTFLWDCSDWSLSERSEYFPCSTTNNSKADAWGAPGSSTRRRLPREHHSAFQQDDHGPRQPSRRIMGALSDGGRLGTRDTGLIMRTSTDELAAKIGQAITVRRYSTKWMERVAEHLTLTGESAIDRITTEPGRQLHAGARGLHGYVRSGGSLRALTSAARLVEDSTGDVFVYRIRDDAFPWQETPVALVAADCFRSTSTRVRSVGIDALGQMRAQWLTNIA